MNQISETEIIKTIADHLGVSLEDISRSSNLSDDLNLGQIELNDLLLSLSQKFNVEFDPQDLEDLQTVDDLVVLVEDNLL